MALPVSSLADALQRLMLSLYDGGVLSPAVLERVIASVSGPDLDWAALSAVRAKDRRSIREIVVAVMMPGNPLDNVDRDFAAVIEHVTGLTTDNAQGDGRTQRAAGARKRRANATVAPKPSEAKDDDALLAQLAGANRSRRKRAKPSTTASNKLGFDLSNNAVPPKRSKTS